MHISLQNQYVYMYTYIYICFVCTHWKCNIDTQNDGFRNGISCELLKVCDC